MYFPSEKYNDHRPFYRTKLSTTEIQNINMNIWQT